MSAPSRHIVAVGGAALVRDERDRLRPGPLVRWLLALTGRRSPRVCLIHTAGGDDPAGYLEVGDAFREAGGRVTQLPLFPMPATPDPRSHLLAQHLVWVGGGSVANLLAVWRVHGLDRALREAWERGVVLAGVSAGGLCWFQGGTTDSFGPALRPFTDGLGLLPASHCPHYDTEPRRRPLYQALVAAGTLGPGWAADDGVALHFTGTELRDVVGVRDGAQAYRVEPGPNGTAREHPLAPRQLV